MALHPSKKHIRLTCYPASANIPVRGLTFKEFGLYYDSCFKEQKNMNHRRIGTMSFPKTFLFFFLTVIFLQNVLDANSDRIIKNARSENSDPALKCGPSESEGVITPESLAREQKKGMTILFLPGQYEGEIVISADEVVITGDPGKFCDARMVIDGKNCVVKNLWIREISTVNNTACIDSIISRFTTRNRGKAEMVFDNCCIGATAIRSYGKTLIYKNSTLCNMENLFMMGGGALEFDNCILYSKNSLFKLVSTKNKVKITISNSLVFARNNFASDRDMRMVAATSKDIKKSKLPCNGVIKNVIEEKPLFKLEVGKPDGNLNDWNVKIIQPRNFILLEDSPGKKEGFGAKLTEEGFPDAAAAAAVAVKEK